VEFIEELNTGVLHPTQQQQQQQQRGEKRAE